MKIGTVKWYKDANGYGFIHSEGKDYFVHAKSLSVKCILEAGQKVSFIPAAHVKGTQAVDVKVLD